MSDIERATPPTPPAVDRELPEGPSAQAEPGATPATDVEDEADAPVSGGMIGEGDSGESDRDAPESGGMIGEGDSGESDRRA